MFNKLLFSFDKEIKVTKNNAGKVWRVFIRNGVLRVGDGVQISSVNLKDWPKSSFFTIDAIVKSIHEEHDIVVEGKKEIDHASKGSIVGLDIKNCYVKRKMVSKKEIEVTKQSIGFSSREQFNHFNEFYIKFTDAEKAIDVIKLKQEISLLWFGQGISARVECVPDSLEGMYISLLYNKKLAIPTNPTFRDSQLVRKIMIGVEDKGQRRFISGLFEF